MRSEAGASVALVSTGIMTRHALTAAELLSEQGFKTNVLHVHTVKPLDAEAVRRCTHGARLVVTVEEHTVIGGLGSAVLDSLIEDMGSGMPAVRRLGIPDTFAKSYGTQDDLLETYGLLPAQISTTITEALRLMKAA
jgi:transketolase